MKPMCRIAGVAFGVMTFFVTTAQGQTLEERIRAIETNMQRLQKEMGDLKTAVDSVISQRKDAAATSVAGVAPAQLSLDGSGLDLSAYKAGETLSENLVVKEDPNGDKYISCSKSGGILGKLKFSSIGLSNKSEIMISVDWNSDTWSIIIISNSSTIRLSNKGGGMFSEMEFGDEKGKKSISFQDTGWRGGDIVNSITISIKDNTANLYVNDSPAYSHVLNKPGTEYHTLIITGIKDSDRVFGVRWKNL